MKNHQIYANETGGNRNAKVKHVDKIHVHIEFKRIGQRNGKGKPLRYRIQHQQQKTNDVFYVHRRFRVWILFVFPVTSLYEFIVFWDVRITQPSAVCYKMSNIESRIICCCVIMNLSSFHRRIYRNA